MKELASLTPSLGAVKKKKIVGRGRGSGHGKTATRGSKGQKSRSGAKIRPWFEGGQMPLQRRVPKRGFHNPFKKEYAIMNVETLNKFEDGTDVNALLLKEKGILKQIKDGVKILGKGKITKKVNVYVHAISESARKKIEDAGGKVEILK